MQNQARRFLVGVCGGIAAYKALPLIRGLQEAGHEVRVVPTHAALQFVGKATFAALAQHPIEADVFAQAETVEHVQLAAWATDIVIAPATANTLAKLAHGIADNLLTTTVLASKATLTVVPAMHTAMWEHPATQANLAILRERGAHVIGPVIGNLSSGDYGAGRMSDPEDILRILAARAVLAQDIDLAGKSVLISAGGTQEPIDPVRYIGNRSSGKQGCAIAELAAQAGANVTLVAANINADLLPPGVSVIAVKTAAQLADAMLKQAEKADIIVMSAAVADFTPAHPASTKIGKTSPDFVPDIALTQTKDILKELNANKTAAQLVIGFSAETGNEATALLRAQEKALAKGSDFTVFNVVGDTKVFGQDDTEIKILDASGQTVGGCNGTKLQAAAEIWRAVLNRVAG